MSHRPTYSPSRLAVAAAIGVLVSSSAALGFVSAADARPGARGGAPTSIGHGGGGGRGAATANRGGGNVNRGGGNVNRGGGNVNRGGNNRTANNSGNRINNGDVNIGNRTNVNVNVDNNHGCCGHDWNDWDDHYHPVARGVAFGAAAAVTAAAVGSMIYSLPPACSPYMTGYYYCGGVYYAPQYQGDTVVYVVVDRPG